MGNDSHSNGAVFRVHKNKNYTVMSNNHLFNKELSLKAKGLMSVILALPEKWNYSIGGLTGLSNDGRDAVASTLKTLQTFGYVAIEKTRGEHGQFKTTYHIFENPEDNNFTVTDFPTRLNRCSSADSDNPEQLNTNNQDTNNQDTNKETHENSEGIFGPAALYELYKKRCSIFPQPRELTQDRIKKAAARLKKRPDVEFWETVFRNAVESDFCKKNKFFCFDWILKNDGNALKVYEGNYSNDKYATGSQNKVINISPMSSSKYASYREKQQNQGG